MFFFSLEIVKLYPIQRLGKMSKRLSDDFKYSSRHKRVSAQDEALVKRSSIPVEIVTPLRKRFNASILNTSLVKCVNIMLKLTR